MAAGDLLLVGFADARGRTGRLGGLVLCFGGAGDKRHGGGLKGTSYKDRGDVV